MVTEHLTTLLALLADLERVERGRDCEWARELGFPDDWPSPVTPQYARESIAMFNRYHEERLKRVERERDEWAETARNEMAGRNAAERELAAKTQEMTRLYDEINRRERAEARLAQLVNATESFMRMGWETEERPRAKLLEVLAIAKGER
jgi:hypothetical protein